MKRFSSILIAAASLVCATNTIAATRPHYGGTLRVGVPASAQTFDPTVSGAPGLRSLTQLVFETLVKLDDRGRPQPLEERALLSATIYTFAGRAGSGFSGDGGPAVRARLDQPSGIDSRTLVRSPSPRSTSA